MKARLRNIALLLLITITAVAAIDVTLVRPMPAVWYSTMLIRHQNQDDRQKCSGMYSKKSWGGKVEPFILVKFIKDTNKNKDIQDPIVSVVVWEWKDTLLLGAPSDLPVNDVGYHPLLGTGCVRLTFFL